MTAPRSWDVFCHVVDNYGDAAVCWRLARALAAFATGRTRLWIDDMRVLHAMLPRVEIDAPRQTLHGVEICHWVAGARLGEPAEVAVDAFGAGIPEEYVAAMAARTPRPLWIVLEYLSAEPWVASHHGLPSPHPRLPIERYFFFPGFERGTGGLLRETDLTRRREEFLLRPGARETLWSDAGFAPPAPGASVISMFGYDNPAVAELLGTWASGAEAVVAAVPQSRLGADVSAWFGAGDTGSVAGRALHRGALEVRFLPFLAQDRYDELLWVSDWNFVRGEDSFVRAQWAERALVWQPYPQSAGAHLAKLDAFLRAYCAGLDPVIAEPLRTLWRAWNDPGTSKHGALERAWRTLAAQGAALNRHARQWPERAATTGDLAENLAKFCSERVK